VLPYLPRRTPHFAFIVHPRDEADIFRATCLSLLRTLSADDADFVARVCALPPTVVGEVLFGFGPFRGEVVSIPCLSAEVTTDRGRGEILRAARLAIDRGAHVIGLGGLTAPATGGGSWLVEQLPAGVRVTNGNAYTAAVLRRHVLEAVAYRALDRPARVAIVGAAGSVGIAVSQLLADSGVELVLIGRTRSQLSQLPEILAGRVRSTADLTDVNVADVVLVLTSAASARLTPSHLRGGTIVIDAAEPANISDADAKQWTGHASVVRGGRVRIPGYYCSYDFGLEDSTETFACLAETYLFAREGISQHSVGAPPPEFAERRERAALRHGLLPGCVIPDVTHASASMPVHVDALGL
jgi:fatty aldehyde-generating acyl-ACP reductase